MTQDVETSVVELDLVSCQTCDLMFVASERRQTCPVCGGEAPGPYLEYVLDETGLHPKNGAAALPAGGPAEDVHPDAEAGPIAEGAAAAVLGDVAAGEPAFEATDGRRGRHRLWVVGDEPQIETLRAAAAASNATMADGHHRYETALDYLAASDEDGRRWVLACLVAEDDPGLVVLPTRRLVREAKPPSGFLARLEELYAVERLAGELADLADPSNQAAVARLWQQVQAGAKTPGTFGLIGLEGTSLDLLRARSPEALDAAMPRGWSPASRSLDVLILTETILDPLLGIGADALAGGRVEFSEDIGQAWEWALSGADRLAFLVNPTRVEQVVAVADAGDVLPQKSTFYYPKLATGMVLNRLD